MRVAIVGCGLIGKKRSHALAAGELVALADLDLMRCEDIRGSRRDITVSSDPWSLVHRSDIDAAIISTSNDYLEPLTSAFLNAGKHVLVEKPAARNAAELTKVVDLVKRHPHLKCKVGFNHRFHPGMEKAKELIEAEAIGPLMMIRGRYGHGGRIGFEQEWRANPEIAGGGELLDQGVHLIDLCLWYFGEDAATVNGQTYRLFWNTPVEDNGFVHFATNTGKVAWLHVSCSEWKNLFSLEIYGRGGKIHIEGLGGSYGTERVSYYKMLPEMGPPATTIYEYPFPDYSFIKETRHFIDACTKDLPPNGDIHDAWATQEIIRKIYAKNVF